MGAHRTSSRGAERGATGVEVALLIALVAVVVIGAVSKLGGHSSSKLNAAGDGIHQGAEAAPGGGGGGGGGGSGTTSPPPTTTPAPTTTPTTPPSTTAVPTTAPPAVTSTTMAPTTTVPPAVASPTFSGGSASIAGTQWNAAATLTVRDQDGRPLAGASVTITVRTRRINSNGTSSWLTTTISGTVGADGTLSLATGPYKRSGNGRIAEIQYSVADISVGGGGSWDGSTPTLGIAAP